MSEQAANLALWLMSPLAVIGAGLLLSQVIGVLLQARLPNLYGAVIAGPILGASRLGLVDAALLSQFQGLFNAASALALFEVGRKLDLIMPSLVRLARLREVAIKREEWREFEPSQTPLNAACKNRLR